MRKATKAPEQVLEQATEQVTEQVTAAEVLNVSEEFLDGAESGYAVREAIRERTDKAKGFVAALFMRKPKEAKAPRIIPPHVLAMLAKK